MIADHLYESPPCGKCNSIIRYINSGKCIICKKKNNIKYYNKPEKKQQKRLYMLRYREKRRKGENKND